MKLLEKSKRRVVGREVKMKVLGIIKRVVVDVMKLGEK
jgi:hypothetical protein